MSKLAWIVVFAALSAAPAAALDSASCAPSSGQAPAREGQSSTSGRGKAETTPEQMIPARQRSA